MDPRPHPADAIEAVRRARGESRGSRHDMTMPNDHLPEEDRMIGEPVVPAAPLPRPPRPAPTATPVAEDTPVATEANEGVSLTQKAGFYQGYTLKLTEGEAEILRAFLGRVVLRHLEEERSRVQRTFAPKPKEKT